MFLENSHFCKKDHSCLSAYRDSQPNEGNSRERQRCDPAATSGKCAFTNSLALHSCLQALANYPWERESDMQEYFKRMGGGEGEYVYINSIACSFDRFGTGRERLHTTRGVTYTALFLPNKESLEMWREKQDNKVAYHFNMMFGSSLALWGRDNGLPMDNTSSQFAEVILNSRVGKRGLKDISKPYLAWAVRSTAAIGF